MFGKVKALHIGLVLAAAAVFVTAGIISAQQPNPEEPVRGVANQLLAAVNNEDVTAVVAVLDSDVVIEGFGFCPGDRCTGIEAVRAALETAAGENVRIRSVPGMERVQGRVWIGEVEVRADSITAGGAERLLFQLEIEVDGGKAVRLRFVPELDDEQTARFLGTGTPASVGGSAGPIHAPSTGSGGLLGH